MKERRRTQGNREGKIQGKDINICCCLPFWKVKRRATERVKTDQTKGGRQGMKRIQQSPLLILLFFVIKSQ